MHKDQLPLEAQSAWIIEMCLPECFASVNETLEKIQENENNEKMTKMKKNDQQD